MFDKSFYSSLLLAFICSGVCSEPARPGDQTFNRQPVRKNSHSERTPTSKSASTAQGSDDARQTRDYIFYVGAGANLGPSYFLPALQIQLAISNYFSLGIVALFGMQKDVATQKTIAAFFSGAYYLTHKPFFRFFIESRLGLYSLTASDGLGTESTRNPAFAALIGWRGRLTGEAIGLGAGVGAQYIVQSLPTRIVNFSGLLPLFNLDLSYSF